MLWQSWKFPTNKRLLNWTDKIYAMQDHHAPLSEIIIGKSNPNHNSACGSKRCFRACVSTVVDTLMHTLLITNLPQITLFLSSPFFPCHPGETKTTVSPYIPGGVSDGQWHSVQLHYYNKVRNFSAQPNAEPPVDFSKLPFQHLKMWNKVKTRDADPCKCALQIMKYKKI